MYSCRQPCTLYGSNVRDAQAMARCMDRGKRHTVERRTAARVRRGNSRAECECRRGARAGLGCLRRARGSATTRTVIATWTLPALSLASSPLPAMPPSHKHFAVPKPGIPRPVLPSEHLNPHIRASPSRLLLGPFQHSPLAAVDASKPPAVKFQEIVREGQATIVCATRSRRVRR